MPGTGSGGAFQRTIALVTSVTIVLVATALLVVIVVFSGVASTGARGATAPAPVLSPAVPALGFTPPAAGSYQLERIMRAPDGNVLDSDGSVHRLREFTTGKVTLFSLIYTYCTDAHGCPLAYAALHALRAMAATDPLLRGQVRLISMSFEPAFDTPAMMRSYAGDDLAASTGAPWHFLTTASQRDLAPVLAGFGQDVAVLDAGKPGERAPVLGHLLKVYLIDPSGTVREIYATAYLHPAVIRNDIATVLMERDGWQRHAAHAFHDRWQPAGPVRVNPSGWH